MDRRYFNRTVSVATASLLLMAQDRALALSLGDLTNAEASQGLKDALEKGALAAVALLGKADGFLGNDKVRIPLPGYLEDAAKLLKTLGQGKRVDELLVSMNRAAEAAVPLAKDLLVGAVKAMSVSDAKTATEKVGLAAKYNRVAAKAQGLGLVKKEDANIQQYVTGKSLDGLYYMIGEEEKKIRQDPIGTGSALLKKVFGALK